MCLQLMPKAFVVLWLLGSREKKSPDQERL